MSVVRHRPLRAPFRPAVAVRATCISFALLLGACGTLTSSGPTRVDADADWAVLTPENLSSTPLAGRQAGALIETRLRARGVRAVSRVEPAERLDLVALLDDGARRDEARLAARRAGARYALAGTVHEWQYRDAPQRDPVVAMSLTLEELKTGRVLWQGSASRTGFGGASLSGVADRVVRDLLDELALDRPQR